MTDSSGFGDDMMLEMFREEAEMQLGELSDGLIALETSDSSDELLERLMRAAHSMKGAARIMGIDPIVKLTHVAEDIFVAAQRAELTLSPPIIDVLLAMTDFIKAFSEGGADLDAQSETVTSLHDQLNKARAGELQTASTPAPAATTEPPQDNTPAIDSTSDHTLDDEAASEATRALAVPTKDSAKPVTQEQRAKSDIKSIRITADAIERLAGLAGEASVESSRVESIADDLTELRVTQRELRKSLGAIRDIIDKQATNPQLDALLQSALKQLDVCSQAIADHEERLDAFTRRFGSMANRFSREVIAGRMLPFSTILRGYPRLVRDLSKDLGKRCRLVIDGEDTMIDREILDRLDSALNHIARNALDHGIEPPEQRNASGKPEEATLSMQAFHQGGRLRVQITDDGKGIDAESIRKAIIERGLEQESIANALSEQEIFEFLFLPGFSTARQITEISGRGVGLDAVRSMVQDAGGSISLTSERGVGTRFDLELPLTRSVLRVLTVMIGGHMYAIEVARIEYATAVAIETINTLESRAYFEHEGHRVALIDAAEILELSDSVGDNPVLSVVVFKDDDRYYGLVVDRYLNEQKLLVRPLDSRLGDVPDVAAMSTSEDGAIVLILDADELQRSMDSLIVSGRLRSRHNRNASAEESLKRLLVVDDSLTVREAERQLLENAGYQVDVAVDGLEAWSAVRLSDYDLVVTDIDMPRMTGIELVKRVRTEGPKRDLPIVIVSYKDRDEDRLLGLEAGANHYVSKGSFSDSNLVDAVYELIGAPQR